MKVKKEALGENLRYIQKNLLTARSAMRQMTPKILRLLGTASDWADSLETAFRKQQFNDLL